MMNNKSNKTLVLGAGINNLVFPENHFLNSWENFTRYFFNAASTPNAPSPLLMEATIRNIALSNVKVKKAVEIEKNILRNIAEEIELASAEQTEYNFDWLLKNDTITDVISLNFNLPFGKKDFIPGNEIEIRDNRIEILNNCQFWKLRDEKKCKIRFWFPHGNTSNPDHMVFGSYRYKEQTTYLGELFVRLKDEERNILENTNKTHISQKALLKELSKSSGFSWLAPFFYNELYFLGTSISADEWAIWSALTLRIRNFSKSENRKYENPIFHMRHGCKQDYTYPQFIQPLYDPSMNFDEQWKKLKEDFSKSKK